MTRETLSAFVDRLQATARYTFTKEEAQRATELKANGFKVAAWRLERAKRIVAVRRGFYVIVPVEYRSGGILPPDWFINDLMRFLEQPYYVGLLSAAELHGAAHQRPQVFQVVTSLPVRLVEAAGVRIRFFKKANLQATPTTKKRSFTGDFLVSSPEATALDLVAYQRTIGGLSRVVTVLQELGESIQPGSLVEAAKVEGQLPCIQRLGWLMEKANHGPVTRKLRQWLKRQKINPVVLEPSLPSRDCPLDPKWHVIVNTEVEGDL